MRIFAEKPTATDLATSGKSMSQRLPGFEQSRDLPPVVTQALASPGQSLDGASRAAMEPLFGHDFSKVRVQTAQRADVAGTGRQGLVLPPQAASSGPQLPLPN
jgi:hypothetical protein